MFSLAKVKFDSILKSTGCRVAFNRKSLCPNLNPTLLSIDDIRHDKQLKRLNSNYEVGFVCPSVHSSFVELILRRSPFLFHFAFVLLGIFRQDMGVVWLPTILSGHCSPQVKCRRLLMLLTQHSRRYYVTTHSTKATGTDTSKNFVLIFRIDFARRTFFDFRFGKFRIASERENGSHNSTNNSINFGRIHSLSFWRWHPFNFTLRFDDSESFNRKMLINALNFTSFVRIE